MIWWICALLMVAAELVRRGCRAKTDIHTSGDCSWLSAIAQGLLVLI